MNLPAFNIFTDKSAEATVTERSRDPDMRVVYPHSPGCQIAEQIARSQHADMFDVEPSVQGGESAR